MLIYSPAKCISTFIKVGGKLRHLSIHKNFTKQPKLHFNTLPKNVSKPWNVLFFGTDEFALPSLKILNECCKSKDLIHRIEVVTAYKGEKNAVIEYAQLHQLPVHPWPPEIDSDDFQIGIVVSFGHLIPERIIQVFPLGMINVHGSLLPRWRGAAPICHALINGDSHTGITIMKIMPKRFDVGSILAQRRTEIQPHDTYLDLYSRLAQLGAELLSETMMRLTDALERAVGQDERGVTLAPKIVPEMSFIDWRNMDAERIYNLQRGLAGIHRLRTHYNDEVIKLLNVKVATEGSQIKTVREKIPGMVIYDKKSKLLYVSCKGDSWVTVDTLIIPGRRPQSATDFGCGFVLNRKEKFCVFT